MFAPAPTTTITSTIALDRNTVHEDVWKETDNTENISVSSSVSSLTDTEEDVPKKSEIEIQPPPVIMTSKAETTTVEGGESSAKPARRRKSKFTVTPRISNPSNTADANTAHNTTRPTTDAVSISFLSQTPPEKGESTNNNSTSCNSKAKTAVVKQVIQ
jgi:hypothetical protein